MASAVLARVGYAVGVVLATIVIVSALVRLTMPNFDPTHGVLGGTLHAVDRMVLHFDYGHAATIQGHPAVTTLFGREFWWDLVLLGGAVLLGMVAGAVLGAWCADHRRNVVARALQGLAAVALCAPVYVVGFGLLLLFDPTFGRFPTSLLAGVDQRPAPWDDLLLFLRSMLVPWAVLGAPVGGVVLRLTVAGTRGALHDNHVQAALARGLRRRTVVWRYAARTTRPQLFTFLGTQARQLVLNVAIVEYTFGVPGLFTWIRRALGQEDPLRFARQVSAPPPDIPLLIAISVWAAVLTMLVLVVSDLVGIWLDPQTRDGG